MVRYRPYIGLAAIAVASLVTFARVFAGGDWILPVFISAAIALGLTTALRAANIPLVLRIPIAVLVGLLFFGYFMVPSSIPPNGIIPRLNRVVEAGVKAWHRSLETVVPVKPERGFVLLAAAAAWVGMVVSEPAAMWGRPIIAAATWIGIFGYVSAIGVDRGRMVTVALIGLGLITMFATTAIGTGPAAIRPAAAHREAARLAPGSATLAAISIAVSLFLPQIVPGFGSAPLVSVEGRAAASRVEISPMTQIKPRISNTPDITVFEVKAPSAPEGAILYWRLLALDQYAGEAWRSAADYQATGGPIESREPFRGRSIEAVQKFHIRGLAGPWMPAAYQAVKIAGADAQVDPKGTGIVTPRRLFENQRYTITSELPHPTVQSLEKAKDPEGLDQYRALAGVEGRIFDFARQITLGKKNEYERVVAISDHLRTFKYSENVPAGHSGGELARFLFQTRAGYCEQFAGAMAVLVRSLGYPARVAVGFLPGDYDVATGTYRVSARHAHAWPEVYFDKIGWVPFEPTPRDIALPPSYALGAAAPAPAPAQQPEVVPPPPVEEPAQQPAPQNAPPVTPPVTPQPEGRGIPAIVWIALIPFTLTLVALISLALVKSRRRRDMYRRDLTPAFRVRSAFKDVEAAATDLAHRWDPSLTPAEFVATLRKTLRLDRGSTEVLIAGYQESVYGVEGVSLEEADATARAARALRSQIWERANFRGKFALAFSPRSLLRPLNS